ncbi:hypothetical protein QTP88_009579 [Uroleucon formosanum]
MPIDLLYTPSPRGLAPDVDGGYRVVVDPTLIDNQAAELIDGQSSVKKGYEYDEKGAKNVDLFEYFLCLGLSGWYTVPGLRKGRARPWRNSGIRVIDESLYCPLLSFPTDFWGYQSRLFLAAKKRLPQLQKYVRITQQPGVFK